MPNFQEYDRSQRGPYQKAKTVTVTRRGLLNFSPSAMAALGNPQAVVYLVDREERLLGFRGATCRTRNAYTVRAPGRSTQASHALGELGADLTESRRYPLIILGGVQCIDFKQPGDIVTSNRSKS